MSLHKPNLTQLNSVVNGWIKIPNAVVYISESPLIDAYSISIVIGPIKVGSGEIIYDQFDYTRGNIFDLYTKIISMLKSSIHYNRYHTDLGKLMHEL